MCTTCGHTNNWNWSTNRCGCGCTTRGRRGEPGVQGQPGVPGLPGGMVTAGIYIPFAGGGQGSATNLIDTDNLINAVITSGDSVKLLPAIKNAAQQVRNYGVNTLNVFPQSGDSIDALGLNVPYPLGAGGIVNFVCFANGAYTT